MTTASECEQPAHLGVAENCQPQWMFIYYTNSLSEICQTLAPICILDYRECCFRTRALSSPESSFHAVTFLSAVYCLADTQRKIRPQVFSVNVFLSLFEEIEETRSNISFTIQSDFYDVNNCEQLFSSLKMIEESSIRIRNNV